MKRTGRLLLPMLLTPLFLLVLFNYAGHALGLDFRSADEAVSYGDADITLSSPSTLNSSSNGRILVDISAEAGLFGIFDGDGTWIDYDGDNDLDILLTGLDLNEDDVTKLYRNDNGTFVEVVGAGGIGNYGGYAAVGDYDNDNDLDVLLVGNLTRTGTYLYRNDGGTFTEMTSTGLPNVIAGSADWTDYDNDNDLDILLTGNSSGGEISAIFRNNGDNTFTNSTIALIQLRNGTAVWGDYDNDNDPDILLTGTDSDGDYYSLVYRNDGSDTFTDINAGLTGVADATGDSAAWGDYDNDNDLDILLAGTDVDFDTVSQVWRNNGDDTFTNIDAGLIGVSNGSVDWGDYDADGDLDILLTGNMAARVYNNNGDSTFTDANFDLFGPMFSSGEWGDFDGDGDLDALLTGFDSYPNAQTKLYRAALPPDVRITKTVTPATAAPGDTITYTLTFSNVVDTATGVVIIDNMPVSITNPSIAGSSGAVITQTGSAPNFVWDVADLDLNEGGVITLTGTLGESVEGNSIITNTASITADYDSDTEANSAAATLTVEPDEIPDVRITKTVMPATAKPGNTITYTLTFSNVSGTATGVVIADSMPVSITNPSIVGASGAVVTQIGSAPDFVWNVEDLSLNEGGVIILTGTLSESVTAGSVITNIASITANDDSDIEANSAAATLTVGPDEYIYFWPIMFISSTDG